VLGPPAVERERERERERDREIDRQTDRDGGYYSEMAWMQTCNGERFLLLNQR